MEKCAGHDFAFPVLPRCQCGAGEMKRPPPILNKGLEELGQRTVDGTRFLPRRLRNKVNLQNSEAVSLWRHNCIPIRLHGFGGDGERRHSDQWEWRAGFRARLGRSRQLGVSRLAPGARTENMTPVNVKWKKSWAPTSLEDFERKRSVN